MDKKQAMAKKRKKPGINESLCIGCGTCPLMCSKTFAMRNDGIAYVKDPEGESEADIQDAVEACPVDAIYWED